MSPDVVCMIATISVPPEVRWTHEVSGRRASVEVTGWCDDQAGGLGHADEPVIAHPEDDAENDDGQPQQLTPGKANGSVSR